MSKRHITVITIDGDPHDYEINAPKGGEVESKNGLLTINTETEGAIYAPGQWVSVHSGEAPEELGVAPSEEYACKPTLPDEPQEFGAKVTFTDDFGKSERFCRQWDGFWATSDGVLFGWRELTHLGTVTLGWDE